MFFGKRVRLFTASFDKEQERTRKYTISPPFNQSQKAFLPKLHLIDILV